LRATTGDENGLSNQKKTNREGSPKVKTTGTLPGFFLHSWPGKDHYDNKRQQTGKCCHERHYTQDNKNDFIVFSRKASPVSPTAFQVSIIPQ